MRVELTKWDFAFALVFALSWFQLGNAIVSKLGWLAMWAVISILISALAIHSEGD